MCSLQRIWIKSSYNHKINVLSDEPEQKLQIFTKSNRNKYGLLLK